MSLKRKIFVRLSSGESGGGRFFKGKRRRKYGFVCSFAQEDPWANVGPCQKLQRGEGEGIAIDKKKKKKKKSKKSGVISTSAARSHSTWGRKHHFPRASQGKGKEG